MPDAIVVGAGHNGLVAANLLADAGWDVLVLEAQPEPGGAVRSGELTLPGFNHDLFSAFYPLAAASPVLARLDLGAYGLRWRRAPHVLANPTPDGRCAVLSTDLATTAASLDTYAAGDGDAWRRLYGLWEHVGGPFLEAMLRPFPPVRGALGLAARLGPRGLLPFARHAILPVRRLAQEEFRGAGGGLLLAGNTLHTDLSPDAAAGGLYGWLLCCLGQQYGFPVPEGGAGQLTGALVRRLEARGGRVECGQRVTKIEVRDGRAVGAVTADGNRHAAARALLADVLAPTLFRELVGAEHLPTGFLPGLMRFQFDPATVKVDWALRAPIPWTAPDACLAGTVHLADSMDHLTMYAAELACGRIPTDPFLIVGQMAVADPTRAQTAWAYTHVPQQAWDDSHTDRFADVIEARIERLAPGFRDVVLARHVFTPTTLPEGAVNGGTAQLHQQLVLRPAPGLARPETPVAGLYLASSSAHPGGGVHGAPGANAARAALLRARLPRRAGARPRP